MKFLTAIVIVLVLAAFIFKSPDDGSSKKQEDSKSQSAEKTPASKPAEKVEKPKVEAYDYGPPKKPAGWREPKDITVQHILISFVGAAGESKLGNKSPRKQPRALELSQELVRRLRDGEAIAPLVKKYSQDRPPGIYEMTTGQPRNRKIIHKSGMVKNFGDVSFQLDVGEVGLAEYHPQHSPYGYHIVMRLK